MLPPGDIRNCIVRRSVKTRPLLSKLFRHSLRLKGLGGWREHSFGNLNFWQRLTSLTADFSLKRYALFVRNSC